MSDSLGHCHLCASENVRQRIDFGAQALSNRYLQSAGEKDELFPFNLGQCEVCGMIQIPQPINPETLKARFDWIRYNEQEGHLDDLVEKITRLPGVGVDSTIGAISFKDDSTIARFEKKGYKGTWRLDPAKDLGCSDPLAGLETIQQLLRPNSADQIANSRGLADLLIVRHILEHSHDPATFLAALHRLVKPQGYLVFEVPDCEPALRRRDYTMFWEEHVQYFTPEIFRDSFRLWGLPVVQLERYVYANENSLVAVVRNVSQALEGREQLNASITQSLLDLGEGYACGFPNYRTRAQESLSEQRTKGKIALFGAGHLSCAWVNFLGVSEYISFVVDDHPQKKGLLMPGSHLPIRGSDHLLTDGIRLCLLTLSPESEAKVVAKNQAFLSQGGRFQSIFPGKPNSFLA